MSASFVQLQVISEALQQDRRFAGLQIDIFVALAVDAYEIRIFDVKASLFAVSHVDGRVWHFGVNAFIEACEEAAADALSRLRAGPAAPPSIECPCGIHRSRCEYHGASK